MKISIETPVFKGGFLQSCIDSVFEQTSKDWILSLLWDGGDAQSREILERLDRMRHPQVRVHFAENRGIARARRFLSEHSVGDWILPLDDDDVLPPDAIEKFLACANEKPWAGIIRARRQFIDTAGNVVEQEPWFPFGPRKYQLGMVSDIFNQAQPYLIQRAAYARTSGWEGFTDFMSAGEDCDIFLKVEEVAPIELLDDCLYSYRLHDSRASHSIKPEGAFEMWRRLADKTIARIGLPIVRATETVPFSYERVPVPRLTCDMVDFVVPAPSRALASLLRSGFPEDALHLIVPGRDVAEKRNAAFRLTSRPVVCFVDEDIDVGDAGNVDALLEVMHERGADVVGPRLLAGSGTFAFGEPYFDALGAPVRGESRALDGEPRVVEVPWLPGDFLLARRQVVNAVGGFDEAYVGDALVDVDFSLKARQRDFKCTHVGTVGIRSYGRKRDHDVLRHVDALHRKWRALGHLLGLPSP